MYKEPERWAMPFQTYVTLTMLQTHTMPTTKSVKLMERSLYSAKFCFVENMLNNGVLHPAMYDIMQEWYNYIDENIPIQADLIGKLQIQRTLYVSALKILFLIFFLVYLRTSPEIVWERMKKRARSEEGCVPLEYLRQLHELHENWLIHGNQKRPAPVRCYSSRSCFVHAPRSYLDFFIGAGA